MQTLEAENEALRIDIEALREQLQHRDAAAAAAEFMAEQQQAAAAAAAPAAAEPVAEAEPAANAEPAADVESAADAETAAEAEAQAYAEEAEPMAMDQAPEEAHAEAAIAEAALEPEPAGVMTSGTPPVSLAAIHCFTLQASAVQQHLPSL